MNQAKRQETPSPGGWFRLTNEAIDLVAASGPSAFAVFCYLVRRTGADPTCWPSRGRIAKDLGLSIATVKRAIHKLASQGAIEIEEKTGLPNRYTLRKYIVGNPGQKQPGSLLHPTRVTSDPTTRVTFEPLRRNSKEDSRKKSKSARTSKDVPPKLLEVITAWNDLPDGIVRQRVKSDPIAKGVLKAWNRVQDNPDARACCDDVPKLFGFVRKATWAHGRDFMKLNRFLGKTKKDEWFAQNFLDGDYRNDQRNGRARRTDDSPMGPF